MPHRLAVVGTRGQAQRVAVPTVAACREAELVGVVGSDPGRTRAVADQLGVRAYPSLDALAASGEVDGVWVTAPNHLHASMATVLLHAGLDVLLEKPLAVDVEAAAAVERAAAASPATLRVAYQHRFRPAHQQLRDVVRSGELGELQRLRVHRCWQFPYFDEPAGTAPSAWRSSPETSGGWAVNDLGSHLVDLVLWLVEARPAAVLHALFARRYPTVGNDSSAFLELLLGRSCLAAVECSNVLRSPGSLLEAYSDTGWARLDDTFGPEGRLTTSRAPEPVRLPAGDPYLLMLEDFIAACRGEPSQGATIEEALLNVELVQAARQRGRFVEDPVP